MRLLIDGEWFDAISSEGQYESDFESIVRSRANSLFPTYEVVPFQTPVESEEGRRIPDLALIDRDYRHWWVVEVEMAHHSLHSHVLPQVEVFSRGRYGEEHSTYLARRSINLDQALLVDMMKGPQPRVLVVVNRNVPDWIEPIHRRDGLVAVVEVFRSGRNRHILRINGDYPESTATNVVSDCRLDANLPGLLELDSPAALGIDSGEQITIDFYGGLTYWARLDISDKVWLNPLGRNPLAANENYIILRDSAGKLMLKRKD